LRISQRTEKHEMMKKRDKERHKTCKALELCLVGAQVSALFQMLVGNWAFFASNVLPAGAKVKNQN